MNFHEYQAKELFASYGIPVPAGAVARTPDEAVVAAQSRGGNTWVVKAQVHAGGRGKAGGVKLVRSHDEVVRAGSGPREVVLVVADDQVPEPVDSAIGIAGTVVHLNVHSGECEQRARPADSREGRLQRTDVGGIGRRRSGYRRHHEPPALQWEIPDRCGHSRP